MISKHIGLIMAIGLVGLANSCPQGNQPAETGPKAVEVQDSSRFKLESYGKFKAGYNSYEREILILTDLNTGNKYICLTDVGIIQIQDEKNKKDEAAADAIESAAQMFGDD